MASDTELSVYNGSSIKLKYAPGSIVAGSERLNAITADPALDIMAGTDKGLAILYSGSTTFLSLLPDVAEVKDLYLDGGGYLYAACSAGLYRVSTKAELVFSESPARCVYVDEASSTIYLGTDSGLLSSSNGGLSWANSLAGMRIDRIVQASP